MNKGGTKRIHLCYSTGMERIIAACFLLSKKPAYEKKKAS
jgi:hypothetical protein